MLHHHLQVHLVYIGQTGDAFLGGAALFVMSLGMGLPLLAIGLGAGKYMPKPGGWMETVTKIFGIVMLAIALWMLERIIPSIAFMFLSSFLLLGSAIYLKVFENIIVKLITTISFYIWCDCIYRSSKWFYKCFRSSRKL